MCLGECVIGVGAACMYMFPVLVMFPSGCLLDTSLLFVAVGLLSTRGEGVFCRAFVFAVGRLKLAGSAC